MELKLGEIQSNLKQLESIDLAAFYKQDTVQLIQEIASKYTNEQQQLHKLCFSKWETLPNDAFGKTLIPDDIFLPCLQMQIKADLEGKNSLVMVTIFIAPFLLSL